MRSFKMATGSGRAVIFFRLRNGGRKTRPRSWMTSFPASPSWIKDGDGGNDVWRTSRRPWRRPTDVCPIHESCRPVEVWLYLDLKSIWSLASPRHYPSDWVSFRLLLRGSDQSAHVESCEKPSTSASSYSTFFFFFIWFLFFFNCTLQLSRIIVQYSGIVGRNLETNLTPTMTILYCYSKQDELLSCHHKFAAYGRMLQPGSCPAIPRS